VLGATFKEDVRDARNSRVEDIICELERLGAEVLLNDPLFEKEVKFEHMTKKITSLNEIKKVDAVILAVSHKEYKKLGVEKIKSWMDDKVIVDVKGILGKGENIYRL
jgi:UDP-N-acetyl-D-galactosamine dehydrogenase